MKKQKLNLIKDPIPHLVIKMAVPVSIGFFFHTMFNVVDTYFASQINSVAVAAITITFPIFFMIIAISSGTRQGATALIANAEGANNKDLAKQYVIQTISFSVVASIIIMIIGLITAPFLFKILHAEGEYFNFAIQYTNILLYGCLFIILDSTPTAGLNAVGDTKTYGRVFIIGFFINLILDPLFIYGFGPLPPMGIKGIAYATIFAEFVATIYVFYRIKKMTNFFDNIKIKDFFPKLKLQTDIFKQAFPASINMFSVGAGFFIVTFFVSFFPTVESSDVSIAAYGIAIRIEQIILLPAIGLNFACLSLVGQNYGSANYDRIKEGYIICLKYGFILLILGGLILFFGASYFMDIFTNDQKIISMGADYLRIAALFTPILGVLNISIALLQGIKKPNFTMLISLFKELIGAVILIFLFAFYLNYQLNGVWIGILLTNYLSLLILLIIINFKLKKIGLNIFKKNKL
jgi:putative MATE family efflux protein